MGKEILYILLFLVLINSVISATVYGTIYDSALDKADNVKVTINTIPMQYQISKDSEYSFEVPPGTYTLKAEQYMYKEVTAEMQETITINEEGTYRLDLILFPVFEDFGEQETESIFESLNEETRTIWPYFLLIIPVAIILFFVFRRTKSKPDKQIPEDLQDVYHFIRKQKRTTQKELRKQFPISEAKISLMISDLEQRNIIKKIKKGRGNIIIIK